MQYADTEIIEVDEIDIDITSPKANNRIDKGSLKDLRRKSSMKIGFTPVRMKLDLTQAPAQTQNFAKSQDKIA